MAKVADRPGVGRYVRDPSARSRGNNLDDLDPGAGEVPDIPQDVAPPAQAKPRRRRGRNTVLDDRGNRSAAGD
ncbi:hypothetical protein OG978_44450 (plasmid) [Streptomyces sp. NBC_01591]|uniref:hypothetical protein n=1 Tax=Streptomyces sp. NBC_01591 TaxID=2975888 RepID=UPI002DDC39A6|nr:hypothetical protein [Streptomyces sp. NBC_01591]WSD74172.1 hypothetical protein OG978_44450 [Streptomyces sp. NBC_01591]